jgi:hypothetical protein
LLPGTSASGWLVFVWARMVRDAATDVLPFSQLGGIVLSTRAAILQGAAPPFAFGTIIVDVTAEMLAQIAYVALGAAILSERAPRSSLAASLTTAVLVGLVVAAAAGALLLVLQRHGRRLTEKLAERLLPRAVTTTAAVGAVLAAIHRSPARIGLSAALHFAGWIASAGGVWIAFHLIGQRVDFASVIAIESLICAARSAAVFIPNALGVQEAAYAVLTPMFGVEGKNSLQRGPSRRSSSGCCPRIAYPGDLAGGRGPARAGAARQRIAADSGASRPCSRNHDSASANASCGGRQR